MNVLLSTLDEPPREVDQLAVLRQIIRDPQVCLAMADKNPQTLADACAAAVNAMPTALASRSPALGRTPVLPKPGPQPMHSVRSNRHEHNIRPPHGHVNQRPPFHARPSFNHMMMPPTMQHGIVAPLPQLHAYTMHAPSHHIAASPTQLQAATAPAQLAARVQRFAPPTYVPPMYDTSYNVEEPRLGRLTDA